MEESSTPAVVLLALVARAFALDNGFGRTPVMGFKTYSHAGCSPNDTFVRASINPLADNRLLAAGYELYQIDCGWQGYDRLSNGFKWSIYTDQVVNSCDIKPAPLRPGSLGYEKQDAVMFAAWNTAYIKVDNCYVDGGQSAPKDPRTDYLTRYGAMSLALQSVGIGGMLVCKRGAPYQNSTAGPQGPAQWTPPLAISIRVFDDIASGWVNAMRIYNEAIIVNLRGLSGTGHFADMDILEVGNPGMTTDEQKTSFTVRSMFKSALMVSTKVPQMSSQPLSILSNRDVIMINQDSLGAPVTLGERFTNDYDLVAGPLGDGDVAVLLVNQSNQARTLSVIFSDVQVGSADAKDLWKGRTSTGAKSYSASAGPHGSLALRLSNVQRAPLSTPALTSYEAEAAVLTGGANVQSCSGCSGGMKIAYLGSGASATISGIRTSQTTSDVRFDYVDCEVGYLSDRDPMCAAQASR